MLGSGRDDGLRPSLLRNAPQHRQPGVGHDAVDAIGAACDKGLFGWPCDPEIEKLRNAFGMAASEDERKKIAKELQTRAMEDVVFLPFGQWDQPLAFRADRIDGIVPNTGLTVLWGITKK